MIINQDGLVKSPIYFVVGLKRQLAVPYVLPNCRFRHYASYIELFPESIPTHKVTFYEIINQDKLVKTSNLRWLSKKLYMRGAENFYYFGVLEYIVMIEILQQ